MTAFEKFDVIALAKESFFTASRSDGPGGQNVNKVNSKITLKFNVQASALFDEEEKARLLRKLAGQLSKEGNLVLTAGESRSQLQNKELVLLKLKNLLEHALVKAKPRKKSKPSKGAIEKRMKYKKLQSEKKQRRQKP